MNEHPLPCYIPDRGDLVWLDLSPHGERRPALVLSPKGYQARTGMALLCPIVSDPKGYAFEVALPAGLPIQGAILSDQVRTLNLLARRAEKIAQLPPDCLAQVLGRLGRLLE